MAKKAQDDRVFIQNAVKTLATNIRFASVDDPVRSIVVTSSIPNEGKTTIATKEKNERLYRAILALETEEECYAFFQDLCTIAELRSMEQRYEVATLLSEGMVYSDILERTGASSATISRVNRALLNGTGGYVSVLGKMKEDGHEQL